tara:strand:+ start:829 stop:1221 length:393 start_codon:yes stop_codon:yes gene_type:complete
MGYRSQVVLAVGKELKPYFLAALAASPDATALVFKHTDHFEDDGYHDGVMLMHWSGIKWHESYEEIYIISKFVSDCDDENLEGWGDVQTEKLGMPAEHFRFVRTGENYDDAEDKGEYLWGEIHIAREIQF